MKKTDFHIGLEFYTASGKWRCTDVGTRVIVAVKLDPENPDLIYDEIIFNEFDFDGCELDQKRFIK